MRIPLSQPLFVLAMLALVFYTMRGRSFLRDRVITLVFGAVGIAFIVWPGLSTRLAHIIGIGRGADLIFYVFILFSLFQYVALAARFRSMERQLTAVVRRIALAEQANPPSSDEGETG